MALQVINMPKWIEENKKFFLPPVCNKMMHNGQLKVMLIGGPNIRKDYHIEEGEELFYMVHGDMCLKVVEKGKFKDIVIKEGEAFLLPARVPHSPQRFENTVGLVIERERLKTETDILRYFIDGSLDVLFEKAFYCEDLGTELPPIINEFFQSEAHKTGKPNPENVLTKYPFELDSEVDLGRAINLKSLIENIGEDHALFEGKHQFQITVMQSGSSDISTGSVDNWVWQLWGKSNVTVNGQCFSMDTGDTLLIPPATTYKWVRESGSCALNIAQAAL
uniref:3-hydroxyanthranilate 3,4-dioxygenase n=1 Tax=Phallusia mammillata TaxID=59560 RepID=A0A6F9DF49_9ASCI|nr:3-hydroxyanthranilate 3,4-dioxygenase-like [Phallusia mammillata]